MNLLNKTLVTAVQAPCLLTVLQMLFTALVIGVMQWPKISKSDRKQVLVWMLIPALFAAMLVSSFFTYNYLNLSFFTILRNLSPMIVLPIECMFLPEKDRPLVNIGVVASIGVMFLGAILYGFDSVSISVLGIACAIINMVFGITERLAQRRLLVQECKDLPVEACVFWNNSLGMIVAFLPAIVTSELSTAISPQRPLGWTDPRVLFVMALSCGLGLGISYFGMACQKAVSATSIMVIQNVVKVGIIGIGVVFFGENIKSMLTMTGICISLAASMIYSKYQIQANDEKKGAEKMPLAQSPDGKKLQSAW